MFQTDYLTRYWFRFWHFFWEKLLTRSNSAVRRRRNRQIFMTKIPQSDGFKYTLYSVPSRVRTASPTYAHSWATLRTRIACAVWPQLSAYVGEAVHTLDGTQYPIYLSRLLLIFVSPVSGVTDAYVTSHERIMRTTEYSLARQSDLTYERIFSCVVARKNNFWIVLINQ